MSLPDTHPALAQLVAELFDQAWPPDRSTFEFPLRAFAIGAPPATVREAAAEAADILGDRDEVREFEAILRDLGYEFADDGEGVSATRWLASVIQILSPVA